MFTHINLLLSASSVLTLQKPRHCSSKTIIVFRVYKDLRQNPKKNIRRFSTHLHKIIQMAHSKMNMNLVLVVIAMMCAGATAQSSCTNVLVSLSPCLNYITGNSSTPSSGCCSNLASVVSSQPLCLCQVLGGGASSLGISINQTQALALPGACKVQTPPTSQCKTTNGKRTKILFDWVEKQFNSTNMCIQFQPYV